MRELLSDVMLDSPDTQHRALQTLSSLTKVSSLNRNLLAQHPDSIPAFLSLSESSSATPTTCALALSILFNLSLNPNLKRPIASNPDLIRHINSIILNPYSSPQSNKLAASLICSLAMLDKNKAGFGVLGTVSAIIKALEASPTNAVHHLLSSLAELCQFHGNCTVAVRCGAVPVLMRMVGGAADDRLGTSLAVLSLLARFEEGIGEIRGTEGVVGMLVESLKRECMASKESATEILLRLFEEEEELMREAAVSMPEFPTLLADLSIRGSAKAREKVGVLMMKMMEADLDCYVEGNPLVLH
ncbi:hypothetical protein QJS10_CPA10g00419 [Acorus calamus]|uniref:U-box domain-containing protein n=1 Tax=Acorus calamus TaxID=4465 RepID=A0AAV9DXH9_ACOCL|nr:hypothetical protein QJS10_CPA10g00419 [Acorus calamus]